MFEYLEVKFGKQNLIPKHDTDTKMDDVFSIDDDVVKLKELGLLSAEVNDQSRIDEILKSIILSFEEFRRNKGQKGLLVI
jgi:hypothetical protein